MEDSNKKNKWYADFYNWYLIALVVIVILPFFAPIFLELGLRAPAKIIYFFYSFTCHQFHHRSFHIFDHQCAWCARDTAIWTGILFVSLLVKYKKAQGIKWYWVIPFIIPMALDGGFQTVFTVLDITPFGLNVGLPDYISNNFTRFITGFIFGAGVSLWISPNLASLNIDFLENKISRPSIRILSLLLVFCIVFYGALIAIWGVTSKNYKPEGIFDSVVRTPKEDFFERRANALCPTTDTDLFAFNCFLK